MSILNSLKQYWWLIGLAMVTLSIILLNQLKVYEERRNSYFAYENVKQVSRIEISDNNNAVILEKQDNRWILNNTISADNKIVSELLRSISIIEAISPVPIAFQDSAKKVLDSQGVTVQIFSNRKKVRSYTLASTKSKNPWIIGQLAGSNETYRLQILNFNGDIIERFNPNPTFWKSNKLEIPQLSDINAIEVEIPEKLDQSYRVDISKHGSYTLYALQNGLFATKFDTLKLQRFLAELVNISYKQIVTETTPSITSVIKNTAPEYQFTIYCASNKPINLKIYPIPIDEYTDELGRTVKHDLNRLYLTHSSNSNVYIVNFIDIYTILKEISFFNPNF